MADSSSSQRSSKEAAALADLKKYLASYNARDLGLVAESLHIDVQVFVDGNLASSGRDTILPSYQQDFDAGKKVVVVGEKPNAKELENGVVEVTVDLQSISSETTVSLHVVYSYDSSTMKQIRHDISDIVVTSNANKNS